MKLHCQETDTAVQWAHNQTNGISQWYLLADQPIKVTAPTPLNPKELQHHESGMTHN